MPVMLLLPFFPLATVLMSGICILASDVKCCTRVECADIVQDTLDGDVDWCYENGGFACCCRRHDPNTYYDDSCESFHAYAKKS